MFYHYFASQERLVLSILPRFVALEMIADMSALEDEVNPQEFHKIYIHQYKDVRYTHTSLGLIFVAFVILASKNNSNRPLVPLQHPFCRHQGFHFVVYEPVGPGSGSYPE